MAALFLFYSTFNMVWYGLIIYCVSVLYAKQFELPHCERCRQIDLSCLTGVESTGSACFSAGTLERQIVQKLLYSTVASSVLWAGGTGRHYLKNMKNDCSKQIICCKQRKYSARKQRD